MIIEFYFTSRIKCSNERKYIMKKHEETRGKEKKFKILKG